MGAKYFGTFGGGDIRRNNYVMLPVETYEEARQLMFNTYGTKWACVYETTDPYSGLAAQREKFGLTEIELGA